VNLTDSGSERPTMLVLSDRCLGQRPWLTSGKSSRTSAIEMIGTIR
jgi:hypothetical protein